MNKKRSLVVAVSLLAAAAFALFLWLAIGSDDTGPLNTLTAQEVSDGWTLLFDGKTTKGWETEGAAEVHNGLLVLGGDRAAAATSADSFEAFEFRCDYRFEAGQEAVLEFVRDGSGSSGNGLGYLTPRPHAWNRAIYTRGGGVSRLQCEPLRKPLFQMAGAGPVVGDGESGRFKIAFRLSIPGNRLALRNVKFRPTTDGSK